MKSIVLAASFGAAVASDPHPDRLAQIKAIKETPGVLWKAVLTSKFGSAAPGVSKSLCGLKGNWTQDIEDGVAKGEISRFSANGLLTETAMPDSFDSETNWPHCAKVIGDIRDQSNCGYCWAFAAAEAASDRMCIATNGSLAFPLSAEDVCFCASSNGCGGGDISSPWHYIMSKGAVSGGQFQNSGPFQGMCADFSMPHCHHHGPQGSDPNPAEGKPGCPSQTSASCPTTCDATASAEHTNFANDKYIFRNSKGGLGSIATASGEQDIQKMIMSGGPVETAFTVYEDFENYDGGIYHHVTGGMAGGHAVKMVGWGVEGGVKYWKVANSWNPYWAEKGYFRIKRGNNEGGIENSVIGSDLSSKWSKKSEQHTDAVVV